MKNTRWTALLVLAMGVSTAMADVVINYTVTGTDGGDSWSGSFTGITSLDAAVSLGGYSVNSQVGDDSYSIDVWGVMAENGQRQSMWLNEEFTGGFIVFASDVNTIIHGGGTWADLIGTYNLTPENPSEPLDPPDTTGFFIAETPVASTTYGTISFTQAVPEPATAGLLGISAGALWLFRRAKNHYRT